MLNIIRQAAQSQINSGVPVSFVEALVLTEPPEITIRLKRDDNLEPLTSMIIVSEHLTDHKRYVSMRKSGDPKWNSNIKLTSNQVDETMDYKGYQSHVHDISQISLSNVQEEFTFEEVEMEVLDGLKEGDEVMVAIIQGGQSYYIFDRFKRYGVDNE